MFGDEELVVESVLGFGDYLQLVLESNDPFVNLLDLIFDILFLRF